MREAEYSVVIQASDFGPGANFVLEMDRATREAERTIAVLSPDYLTALFTHPEWAATFAQRRSACIKCQIEGLPAQVVDIDLVGHQDAVARRLLLDGVQQRVIARSPARRPQSGTSRTSATPTLPAAKTCFANSVRPSPPDEPRPSSPSPEWAAQARPACAQVRPSPHGDCEIVWWFPAEESATLTADYARLATVLGLPKGPRRPASHRRVGALLVGPSFRLAAHPG